MKESKKTRGHHQSYQHRHDGSPRRRKVKPPGSLSIKQIFSLNTLYYLKRLTITVSSRLGRSQQRIYALQNHTGTLAFSSRDK